MNYVPQYHIGNCQNPTAKTTEATTQTVGGIRRVDETPQRCRRSKKRPKEVSSYSDASHAFLKCSFLPKLKEDETVQACKESKRLERDFYQSLSNLAEHYKINPISSHQFEYPYNIALAIEDVQKQLKKKIKDWEEIGLIEDKGGFYFTSEERYNTGATLYYIPILPLYRLSKISNNRKSYQLLLSVYSYLYHTVHIPYYRQEESYLFWMYDMFEQWVTEDEETEDSLTLLAEIKQAELIGGFMEKKIYNHQNLHYFETRLQQFKPQNNFEKKCLEISKTAFHLMTEFPHSNIFTNAKTNSIADYNEEDEEGENVVTMDKYISFCADATGLLFDNLFQSVNNELQEYGQMEEPVIIKHFNGSDVNQNTLEFENQIFDLITELIDLMNNF